mmetsp:Transcript_21167/g.46103  ORF Transcript_21167/g.46103 Transcript_21167/m.46103 type:complete len:302 (-) Transcript_21167:255-1160(-)
MPTMTLTSFFGAPKPGALTPPASSAKEPTSEPKTERRRRLSSKGPGAEDEEPTSQPKAAAPPKRRLISSQRLTEEPTSEVKAAASPKRRRLSSKGPGPGAKGVEEAATVEVKTPRKIWPIFCPHAGGGKSKSPASPAKSPGKAMKSPGKVVKSPGAKQAKAIKTRRRRTAKGKTAKWGILRMAGLKAPRNAWTLWSNENRKRIQTQLAQKGVTDFAAVSRALGEAWAQLPEKARAPYLARYESLRSVYKDAKAAYMEYAKKHAKEKKMVARKGHGETRKHRTNSRRGATMKRPASVATGIA